jgi:hypothetical protein
LRSTRSSLARFIASMNASFMIYLVVGLLLGTPLPSLVSWLLG